MGPMTASALISELRRKVGDTVHPADDSTVVAGVRPSVVAEPQTVDAVAALLAIASSEGLKVLIRGGGTQETTGFPPSSGDILLSLRTLDKVVDYTAHDQTITVQCGMRMGRLQEALAPAGQWLALDPPIEPGATIGGVVSTNVSGPRRLRYGGVRDQLLGVRVALADGTLARGGGKVVKNVAGYDLPKLFTGALGTLGVVVEASFRVYPRLTLSQTLHVRANALAPLCALASRINGRPLTPTSLDLFDGSVVPTAPYGLAVRFESHVKEAVEEQVRACMALAAELDLPGEVLSGDGEQSLWYGLAARPRPGGDGKLIEIKASLLPSEIGDWLDRLKSVAERERMETCWRAHAGHGLVIAYITGATEPLVTALGELREAARERRGTLVVTSAPPELSERFDVWGPSPALELMRAVKARFDPQSTLNPGRFIGRL